MRRKEKIKYIVIHHSAGLWGDLKYINELHEKRGFPESKDGNTAGYHAIILNGYPTWEDLTASPPKYRKELDGKIVRSRMDLEIGAHMHGLNGISLGVCLIGSFKNLLPSIFQINSLFELILEWCQKFGLDDRSILGHCDGQTIRGKSFVPIDKRTDCPGDALNVTCIQANVWRHLQNGQS